MKAFLEVAPPGAKSYPVYRLSGREAVCAQLEREWKGAWKCAIFIADETTDALFANRLADQFDQRGRMVLRFRFPPGEKSKSRETKARIEDAMLAAGVDRGACIVAVGGGIALDVAGFIAATYMRGIAHINVATSLLAQVDAAIGGKTAINTAHGKNLIGAIHHPRAVLLDTDALASLPDVELQCGLAEAIKHAMLSDEKLFAQLEAWSTARDDLRPPSDMLERCVAIKAEVVAADDRDRGKRNILNYGHTAAHAIEHATQHATPHGHAVAIGMVIESRLAMQEARFPEHDLARLIALLEGLGLPTAPPCSFDAARDYLSRDKKTVAGQIRCAIPTRLGHTVAEDDGSWTRGVTEAQMQEAWT